MSVISRVGLVALLSLFFIGGAVAQTATYSFCYYITGLAHETLDDPYSIAVLVTGKYNTTLLTSTATKYTPAGTYYQLLSATGNRTVLTRNGVLANSTIAALAAPNTLFSDNRFYISNSSQFVDGDGLTFNLTTSTLFPGKTSATQYNIYRSGTYGAVLESTTSGEDLTKFNFTASFPGFTGNRFVAGACKPGPLESGAAPALTFASGTVYTITLKYNISSEASEAPWNVVVSVAFKSTGTVVGPDAFGDKYILLSQSNLPANGTRKYCFNGTCSTSAIYRAAPLQTFKFVDNQVYSYTPYFDYNGIGYLINPAQPKPGGGAGVNVTTAVNPYVSKGGQFFEGFGAGGTNPGGYANNALTTFSVAITH